MDGTQGSSLQLQERYNEVKVIIKTWEAEYQAANAKRPDRAALAGAPEDVRVAYKSYHRFRRELEHSCGPASFTDTTHTLGKGETTAVTQTSAAGGTNGMVNYDGSGHNIKDNPTETSQTPSVVDSGKHAVDLCENDETFIDSQADGNASAAENVATAMVSVFNGCDTGPGNSAPPSDSGKSNVWGRHLNKNMKPSGPKRLDGNVSLYSKMAEKLRAGGSAVKVRTSLKKSRAAVRKPQEAAFKPLKSCGINSESTANLQTNKENIIEASDHSGVSDDSRETVTDTVDNSLLGSDHSQSNTPDLGATVSSSIKQVESSMFDDMQLMSPKVPFRVQRRLGINVPNTQAVSALSLTPRATDRHTEVIGVKRKASLNRGWLARCTGASLAEDETLEGDNGGKSPVAVDSWKMRLIDKEWEEKQEEEEEEEENSTATGHRNDLPSSQRTDAKEKQKPAQIRLAVTPPSLPARRFPMAERKSRTRNSTARKTTAVTGDDDSMEGDTTLEADDNKVTVRDKPNRQTSRRKTLSVMESLDNLRTPEKDSPWEDSYAFDEEIPSEDGEDDEPWEFPKQRTLRSRKTSQTVCNKETPDECAENEPQYRKERNVARKRKPYEISDSEESESEENIRERRPVESLEELEESGKIQCVWPPPKKKRIARKKTPRREGAPRRERAPRIRQSKRIPRKQQSKRTKHVGEGPASLDNTQIKATVEEEPHNTPITSTEPNAQPNNTGPTPTPQADAPLADYDEIQDIESHGLKNRARRKYVGTEERFARKVATGSANNNFVRINLKKKVFVRGRKTMTAGKYKRQEWKKKQVMKDAEQGNASAMKKLTCFKCGDFGHWSRNCTGVRGDALMPLENYNEAESTFLSLEDAASLAVGIKPNCSSTLPVSKLYSQNEVSEKDPSLQPTIQEETETTHEDVLANNGEEKHVVQEVSHEIPEDCTENSQMNLHDDIFANMEEVDMYGGAEEEEEQEKEDIRTHSLNVSNSQSETKPPGTTSGIPSSQGGSSRPHVEPLYSADARAITTAPDEVYKVLQKFGYSSFRPGQEQAIIRVLCGKSTLLVQPTGSGKSLCYQLPAYLYAQRSQCITICVSPLVSLMEDQVSGMPRFLHAVCLHTHQNTTQRTQAMNAIRSGAANILLVSPEAVVISRSGGVLGSLLKELPPVAFACLDEAHCVSEWSHNFRPSYLRVCQVLREKLGVRTILGLTATARQTTALSIARHLLISDSDSGIICGTSVPGNLHLSVSRDQVKEQALLSLLQGNRFSECNSIIVYCTRRDECERIATLIRTQLMDPSKVDIKSNLKRTRGMSLDAEAYHAGLSSHRRHQVQKWFMAGKLRIVVATVAFGMGIDKSDVRGIIHFNMPRNAESYVQEIGRSGRDGKVSHCHLFLDATDGRDIQELKRHIYANSVDRHTIRKLLNKIFKPCACVKLNNLVGSQEKQEEDTSSNAESDNNGKIPDRTNLSSGTLLSSPNQVTRTAGASECDEADPNTGHSGPFTVTVSLSSCPQHEVAVPIDSVVEELDLPEENLETLLCYLELHQENLVHLNPRVYSTCTVSCYRGPRQLVAVSRTCPPLAVAIALERQRGVDFDRQNTVTFPVVEVASRMGWSSKIVKRELKALEWNTQDLKNGGKVQRTGVMVEFSNLAFHMEARGDLTDDECDQILDTLFRRAQTQEQDQLRQLYFMYQVLHSVSHGSILLCCDAIDMNRCKRLRRGLQEYFSKEGKDLSEIKYEEKISLKPEVELSVCNSVRALLSTHTDQQWTGRAVARVFHGIGSPNFPTEVWCRVRRFWRQQLNVDFNLLMNIATREILKNKCH